MQKNPYPGKFIVLEGLDGAGKSTQAALIAGYLKGKGFAVCQTSEPTQFLAGGLARACLLGQWQGPPECLQLLFAADRADHLMREIIPRLEGGDVVICDRYLMSSVAYGAVDIDFDWLAAINQNFLAPDLTIFLRVPAQICVKRMTDNGRSIELFEKKDLLEKVDKNYRMAISHFGAAGKIIEINGEADSEMVFGHIKQSLNNI